MENPVKIDDLGGPPLFLETSILLFWILNTMTFVETNRQSTVRTKYGGCLKS